MLVTRTPDFQFSKAVLTAGIHALEKISDGDALYRLLFAIGNLIQNDASLVAVAQAHKLGGCLESYSATATGDDKFCRLIQELKKMV